MGSVTILTLIGIVLTVTREIVLRCALKYNNRFYCAAILKKLPTATIETMVRFLLETFVDLGIASIVSCRAVYDRKPWVWQTASMVMTSVTGIYVLVLLSLLLGFMVCISEIYYRNQGNIAIRAKLNPMYSIYRHTSR
jgi:hypothetical protein